MDNQSSWLSSRVDGAVTEDEIDVGVAIGFSSTVVIVGGIGVGVANEFVESPPHALKNIEIFTSVMICRMTFLGFNLFVPFYFQNWLMDGNFLIVFRLL
jgi:hypothetical protein